MRITRKRRPATRRRPKSQLERVHELNRRGDVTVDEYLALGEDEGSYRTELINGVIDVTGSPNSRHQKLVFRLARILAEQLEDTGLGDIYGDLDTVLDGRSSLRPDVIFVSKARSHIVADRIYGAPDLVIEILSDSTRTKDLGEKLLKYAAGGIPNYWIVDPVAETIAFYRLGKKGYARPASARSPATVRPPGLPRLKIPLAKIFAP